MRKRLRALLLATALMLTAVGAANAQYVMGIGSLIVALRLGDMSGLAEGIDRANTVYVARLSDIAGVRVSGRTLDRTLADRSRMLRHLRGLVRQSRIAMKALERHGHHLDQVILVTVTNDGTATLYVDDR